MKTTITRKRPRSTSIKIIEECAPWVLISHAAKESGLTSPLIRNSGIELRPFGNADYVRPADLNAWILDGGGTPSVIAMIAARAHLGGDADPLLATLIKEGQS